MELKEIAEIITSIGIIAGVVIPVIVLLIKIRSGVLCLMRNTMLRIYYNHENNRTIRQYEYENFSMLYKAYKALWGNSFVDRIKREIETWKVIS